VGVLEVIAGFSLASIAFVLLPWPETAEQMVRRRLEPQRRERVTFRKLLPWLLLWLALLLLDVAAVLVLIETKT
jgi:hypothetical protein